MTTWREFEWNPSAYNIAAPLDLILNTEYAAKPQRLRTILKRLTDVPAYYAAAVFIPAIAIVAFIARCFWPGTGGANRYASRANVPDDQARFR